MDRSKHGKGYSQIDKIRYILSIITKLWNDYPYLTNTKNEPKKKHLFRLKEIKKGRSLATDSL